MEATEYVSPGGITQTIDSPVVAVRLRTRGWRPRAELEDAAAYDQAAAERLQRMQDRAEQREQRRQKREDETSRRTAGGEQPARAQQSVLAPPESTAHEPEADEGPEEKSRTDNKPKPEPKRRAGR